MTTGSASPNGGSDSVRSPATYRREAVLAALLAVVAGLLVTGAVVNRSAPLPPLARVEAKADISPGSIGAPPPAKPTPPRVDAKAEAVPTPSPARAAPPRSEAPAVMAAVPAPVPMTGPEPPPPVAARPPVPAAAQPAATSPSAPRAAAARPPSPPRRTARAPASPSEELAAPASGVRSWNSVAQTGAASVRRVPRPSGSAPGLQAYSAGPPLPPSRNDAAPRFIAVR